MQLRAVVHQPYLAKMLAMGSGAQQNHQLLLLLLLLLLGCRDQSSSKIEEGVNVWASWFNNAVMRWKIILALPSLLSLPARGHQPTLGRGAHSTLGKRTVSIRCTTPLSPSMSAAITLARTEESPAGMR